MHIPWRLARNDPTAEQKNRAPGAQKRAGGLCRLLDGGGEMEYNQNGIKVGTPKAASEAVPPLGIDMGKEDPMSLPSG